MRRVLIWCAALLVVTAATGGLLYLATSGAASFRVDGPRLHVSGTLTLASTERIDALTEQHPELTTVILGEISADSDATALIQKGGLLRSLGLDTMVAPDVTLAGDAVYLFLGGVERRLGEGAAIAVSDWQTPAGPAAMLPADHPAHAERRLHVAEMLGDGAFYDYAIAAAPVGAQHEMSAAEIAAFGLVTGG